jgi:hypothetical protein
MPLIMKLELLFYRNKKATKDPELTIERQSRVYFLRHGPIDLFKSRKHIHNQGPVRTKRHTHTSFQ